MKLALPLALPIGTLIDKESIKLFKDIDVYQYRDDNSFNKRLSTIGKELIFHSSVGVISNRFLETFAALLPRFMLQDFELFSCNLSPACEDYEICKDVELKSTKEKEAFTEIATYNYYNARSRILLVSEIVNLVEERVKKIKPYFEYVAVENSNRYLQSAYNNICDPKVLSRVVNENDIYFCFDIAHAITSYRNYYRMQYSYSTLEEFIFAHPLDRCIEIHLSSPGPDESPFCDRHLAPTDFEFDILEKVLKEMYNEGNRYRNLPLYIAIEYYGDINILAACYDRVKEMIK